MRMRLTVERLWGQVQARLLATKLDRLAEELGPVSFRTPDFLGTEMRLALALGRLAAIEFETGEAGPAGRAFDRAEQIYMALRRFLPHAQLDESTRREMDSGMERLRITVEALAGRATAA